MSAVERRTENFARAAPSITDRAEGFLAWWLGELRAMVPAGLLAKTSRAKACPVNLFLDAEGGVTVRGKTGDMRFSAADEAALARHLEGLAKARPLGVRIDVPKSLCFVRGSMLPKRALRDARQLLDMEATENTPLSPDAVHSDWYVETEDPLTGRLHVRHVMLSRSRIAPLRDLIDRCRLELAQITVGHGEGRPLPVGLFSPREPGLRGFLRALSWTSRLSWALALLLLALLPSLMADRAERELTLLTARRAQVMALIPAAPAADQAAFGLARIMPMMDILNEVSARLPVSAVLRTVEFDGDVVTVTLASGASDAVREALSASALLDVSAGGPLSVTLRPKDAGGTP